MNYRESMKIKYRNYGEPWTPQLDYILSQLFKEGKTIEQLMVYFGRNEGGILARLEDLYLIDPGSVRSVPKYNPKLIEQKENEIKKQIEGITRDIKEKYNVLNKKHQELLELSEKKMRQNLEYEVIDQMLKISINDMLDNGWYEDEEEAIQSIARRIK